MGHFLNYYKIEWIAAGRGNEIHILMYAGNLKMELCQSQV